MGSREEVLRCYTQLQWTSACWHPAHFTVQYLSEPVQVSGVVFARYRSADRALPPVR